MPLLHSEQAATTSLDFPTLVRYQES